jgi:hypothetical protein
MDDPGSRLRAGETAITPVLHPFRRQPLAALHARAKLRLPRFTCCFDECLHRFHARTLANPPPSHRSDEPRPHDLLIRTVPRNRILPHGDRRTAKTNDHLAGIAADEICRTIAALFVLDRLTKMRRDERVPFFKVLTHVPDPQSTVVTLRIIPSSVRASCAHDRVRRPRAAIRDSGLIQDSRFGIDSGLIRIRDWLGIRD